MEKANQRFEFLLTKQERRLLARLAEKRKVSQGALLRDYIRRAAKKAGL